jgi:DNA-directed RNA polymerase subunit RPC12/RpoP
MMNECPECGSKRIEKLRLYRCPDCGAEFMSGEPFWVSVKTALPKHEGREDNKSYYVYLDDHFGCRYAVWLYLGNGEWWREDIDRIETTAVTHWRHLPEPPEDA